MNVRVTDIMCVWVGASGSGRSTFVNTLCGSEVLSHDDDPEPENAHIETGIQIKPHQVGQYLLVFASVLGREKESL